jgi:putative transposase
MKQVDNSFKSFFNLLKAKKSGTSNNPVKIPKYLNKEGYYKVVYTKIHFKILENGYIRLSLPRYLKEKYNVSFIYFKRGSVPSCEGISIFSQIFPEGKLPL